MARDWGEHYASGELPWDTGRPASELMALIEAGRLPVGIALDVGCGTGTNVRYLASQGYRAIGIDIAPLAIERAKASAESTNGSTEFFTRDFLHDEAPASRYDLVFDRGCFHVFDEAEDRERFARQVATCLSPEGVWLSLLGSTEGPPREYGPPRRSARDVVSAVEPALEIVELRGVELDADPPEAWMGWVLLARRRSVPAQPSSVHPD